MRVMLGVSGDKNITFGVTDLFENGLENRHIAFPAEKIFIHPKLSTAKVCKIRVM